MSIYNYKELYEMWKENAPQTDDKVALNEDWAMFVDSLVREGKVSELMWKYLTNTDEIPEDTQEYLEEYTEHSVCPETYEEVFPSFGQVVTQIACRNCDEQYSHEGDLTDSVVRCPRCSALNEVVGADPNW